ncbi:MAG: hypothetical protein ACM3IH_14050 [Sphingobacteriales bacterium]
MNSLGSASMSSASAAYDNATNLNIYVDIEVNLASLSPASGAYVALYIAEQADGTNYPAPSAADMRLSQTQLLCIIPVGTTASTAQRVVVRNVVIPPASFKIYLDNQCGVALAASGSTVKFLAYNINGNG